MSEPEAGPVCWLASTRSRTPVRWLIMVLVAAFALFAHTSAFAQIRSVTPPRRDTTLRTRADTLRRDSTTRDSTKQKELIKWNPTDSVMQALIARPGYEATKYQGDRVVFNVQSKTLNLVGKHAGVDRGQSLLVADTITYNDSTKILIARGDTNVLRDPTQGTADVVSRGRMAYNVELHRGLVTNITTSIQETGQEWHVGGADAAFVSDTTRGRETAFYVRNGSITSCDDSIPDYHFQSKEIKMVSKNIMVARPAVLYSGEVPVMWLPFIFQDMRSGRRSGVITPRFGVSELFRNSPTYRRHVENLGYYFAISDYMDAQFAVDWRSGARASSGDPGYVRLNGEMQYRWLDRFMSGSLAMSRLAQRDGTGTTNLSWQHSQDFSQETHLTANINYVTNTFVQRTTTFNPNQVLATIHSQVNYSTMLGPAQLSLGGSREQHPGRGQVDQTFPQFSLSSPVISLTKWLDWNPTFNFQTDQHLNIDQVGEFPFRFFTNAQGLQDSTKLNRSQHSTTAGFTTPLKIAGFSWNNSFRLDDNVDKDPKTFLVVDPVDSTKNTSRVFAENFLTNIDWQTSFDMPSLLHGSLNLAPSLSFQNVDGQHGFWVRSNLSGGQFVHQSKRATGGLTASPTLYALFPGFGNVSRFRHSITPIITFSYAPTGSLSNEYLAATNTSRQNFLGSLPQKRITLGLSHVLEAKMKSSDTSSTAEARKLKILSMNLSPLTYDIERARKTHRSGFSTSTLQSDVTSDLIPGFRGSVEYSLYQGDVLSDTARFKPFRDRMDASFSLNGQSGIIGVLTRLFGKAVPEKNPQMESVEPKPDDALANQIASSPVAGITARDRQYSVPTTQGWQATFNYSWSRQRPPTGNGVKLQQHLADQCIPLQAQNPFAFDLCVQQANAAESNTLPLGSGLAGSPFIIVPPQSNLGSQMTFHLTPKWSGSWGTNYDFQAHKFGTQNVTLQRELHDWRAIFTFVQAPNGNFAFTFFIALSAEPDLKFNYDKSTYRPITR
jgi:hypothetical protein